jgi:Ca2+-transporting ATPase
LGTDPVKGLSEVEAYNRLRRFGTNEIERPYLRFRQVRFAALFCIAGAIVMAAKGARLYALGAAIAGIGLVILAVILKDYCNKALAASRDTVPYICTVIRGNRLLQIPAFKLVPGDIVRIRAGEIVPADGRLTEAVMLVLQEGLFSDNSRLVEKDALHPSDPSELSTMSKNHVFMNTMVVGGRGTFVVTETGMNTRIARMRSLERRSRGHRFRSPGSISSGEGQRS